MSEDHDPAKQEGPEPDEPAPPGFASATTAVATDAAADASPDTVPGAAAAPADNPSSTAPLFTHPPSGPQPLPRAPGPHGLVVALLVILLAIAAGVHGFNLNRGFDFTDEGAFLSACTHPADATPGPSLAAAMLGRTLGRETLTVPAWRTWNAQALITATLVLTIALRRWLRACDPSLAASTGRAPLYVLALLGTYTGLYGWPQSPLPDTLVTVFAWLALAAAFTAATPGRTGALSLVFAALAGAFAALLALVRAHAGGAIGLLVVLILLPTGRRSFAAAVAGAIAAGFFTAALLVPNPAGWIEDIRWARDLPYYPGATVIAAIVHLSFGSIAPYLAALVAVHGIAGAAAAAREGRSEGIPHVRVRRWASAITVLGLIAQSRWISDHFGVLSGWQVYVTGEPRPISGNAPHVYVLLLCIAAATAIAGRRLTTGVHGDTLLCGLAALFAAPLACGIGGFEGVDTRARAHLAPWLLLIALVCGSTRRNVSAAAADLVLLATAAIACTQFTVNHVYAPYRTAPLFTQVQAAPLPRAAGLLFDPVTASFLTSLRDLTAAAGHRPGRPLLAFEEMPGVTYLLDGTAPGEGWFHWAFPQRTAAVLTRSSADLTGAVILVTGDLAPEVRAALAAHHVRFPEEYRAAGSIPLPFPGRRGASVTVWAPMKR